MLTNSSNQQLHSLTDRDDPNSRSVNTPRPVDRMAEIKAEIATLEAEFAELREILIADPTLRTGDLWEANVSEFSRRHITVKDAQKLLSSALFDSLVKTTSSVGVWLKRRSA